VIDYHTDADPANDIYISSSYFTMSLNRYNFVVDNPETDIVKLCGYEYNIEEPAYIPFIVDRAIIDWDGAIGTLTFGQAIKDVSLTHRGNVKTYGIVRNVKINGGWEDGNTVLTAYNKLYRAEIMSGASCVITNYGRNIFVHSGGTLVLAPTGDLTVKFYGNFAEEGTSSSFAHTLNTFVHSNVVFTHISSAITSDNVQLYKREWQCEKDSDIKITCASGAVYTWNFISSNVTIPIGSGYEFNGPEEVFDSRHMNISCIHSGIPTIDNLKIESGASAIIRGYVTGYEQEEGAENHVLYVDSKFIRTNTTQDKEFDPMTFEFVSGTGVIRRS